MANLADYVLIANTKLDGLATAIAAVAADLTATPVTTPGSADLKPILDAIEDLKAVLIANVEPTPAPVAPATVS